MSNHALAPLNSSSSLPFWLRWRNALQSNIHELGLAQLIRLSRLRWLAIMGQLIVIAVAQFALGVNLPYVPLLGVIALLALFNGLTMWRIVQARRMHSPINSYELFNQLFVDLVGLSALLFFAGGATNPFVSFYLPALAIAAAILPWLGLLALALLALLAYTIMSFQYVPLDLADPNNAVPYHLAGMWVNFVLSVGLIVLFVARLSHHLRQREIDLAQANETLLRDERMVALGAQAASIAHDLGTPLATVAVLAGELQNEIQHDEHLAPYAEDLQEIEQQIVIMKQTLLQLQQKVFSVQESSANQALEIALKDFAKQWRLRHPQANLALDISPSAQAIVVDQTVIQQILTTLLDNAVRSQNQTLRATWPIQINAQYQIPYLTIDVVDWGIGLSPELEKNIAQLGDAPISKLKFGDQTKGNEGQGIGLYLARTVARRLGGDLTLASHQRANPNGNTIAGSEGTSGVVASLRLPTSS